MSANEESEMVPVVMLPNGALQFGDITHEPWPSLKIHPFRSLEHVSGIVRPTPGSAFWEFAQRIPEPVRELARGVPCYQYAFLEMCTCPEGLALAEKCPALAVQLLRSHLPAFHGECPEYIRRMVRLPWRELLLKLGLPARPRTMRILAKVPLEHCHRQTVARLGAILREDSHCWLRVLPHLRRITRDSVALLGLDPRMINSRLLHASADSDWDEEPVAWTLGSIQSLRRELGRAEEWPYGTLDYAAVRLVEGRLQDAVMAKCHDPFPTVPLKGRPGEIEQICSFDQLLQESAEVENCAITLMSDIMAGRIVAFRVLHPERATLVLRCEGFKDWSVVELRAVRNTEVTAETENYIRSWLSESREAEATPQHNE